MTSSHHELLRRCTRLALTAIGTVFTLIFVRATQRGKAGAFIDPLLPDVVVLAIAIGLALAILVGAGVYFGIRVRAPLPPSASFWRTEKAMFLSIVVYLVGAGLLCAWVAEWAGDDEGALAFFITALLVVVTSCATESGRLPALALLAGSFVASVAAMIRILSGPRDRYADEVFGFGVFSLFLIPLSYLLVRGLLNLVAGRSETSGGGTGFGLPLQVVAQDGTYMVTVEAPGLTEGADVEARVAGHSLHLVIARPTVGEGELIYSTRCSGRFPVIVELPQPLQDPWNVSVEHGLVTVQVAPIGRD